MARRTQRASDNSVDLLHGIGAADFFRKRIPLARADQKIDMNPKTGLHAASDDRPGDRPPGNCRLGSHQASGITRYHQTHPFSQLSPNLIFLVRDFMCACIQ